MEERSLGKWIADNATVITIWSGALCTFAIYSILYKENKLYRLFEHIFIGLAAGYGAYIIWSEVLLPKWWAPMIIQGEWYWVFAGIAGSLFYFVYSKKHSWISKIIFGAFMGLSAGGMFREFYEIYFRQIGASMRPIVGGNMSFWSSLNAVIFYVILFSCMSYFFFSFEHKNTAIKKTASAGRWFLMIGFGSIFGATVMGRMTLVIGRMNFLLNTWGPTIGNVSKTWEFYAALSLFALITFIYIVSTKRRVNIQDGNNESDSFPSGNDRS